MKREYPVFLTRSDGIILVEVPDLEILTEGKDYHDAFDMARDAIELKCAYMKDANEEIPTPSSVRSVDVSKGTFSNKGKTTVISLVEVDI